MGRRSIHSSERILHAAGELVAVSGVQAATIGSIAEKLGAPTGSIYHRFPSRRVILARVWLDAVEDFQRGAVEALDRAETLADGLAAALHVPRWVSDHPIEARILLLHRREEFLGPDLPPELVDRARTVNRQVEASLMAFATRVKVRRSKNAIRRLTFALVDAPLAAVRPHIRNRQKTPPIVDELIEQSYAAVTSGL